MKTHNWQTKALTLFIAAAALCLTAACGDVYPIIITPSAPCGDHDGPAEVSIEFQGFSSADERFGEYGFTDEWLRAHEAWRDRLRPEIERVEAIMDRNQRLIYLLDYPPTGGYYVSFEAGVTAMRTEEGLRTDKFIVYFRTPYPEALAIDRLPECVEGLPVHITIEEPLEKIYDPYFPLE